MRKGGRELRPRPSWYDLPSRDVPRARQPAGQEQGLDVNLVNGRDVREMIYCFFFPHGRDARRGCSGRKELLSDIHQARRAKGRKISLALNVWLFFTWVRSCWNYIKNRELSSSGCCAAQTVPRAVKQRSIWARPRMKTHQKGSCFSPAHPWLWIYR